MRPLPRCLQHVICLQVDRRVGFSVFPEQRGGKGRRDEGPSHVCPPRYVHCRWPERRDQ